MYHRVSHLNANDDWLRGETSPRYLEAYSTD